MRVPAIRLLPRRHGRGFAAQLTSVSLFNGTMPYPCLELF